MSQILVPGATPGIITTEGDLIGGDSSGLPSRIPVGTAGQFLGVSSGALSWAAAGGGPAAKVYEQEVTVTTGQTVLTYTPTASGLFLITGYLRIITAATVVEMSVTHTDATGAQTTILLASQSLAVGSYGLTATTIADVLSDAIDIVVTVGTANQVYASAGILQS